MLPHQDQDQDRTLLKARDLQTKEDQHVRSAIECYELCLFAIVSPDEYVQSINAHSLRSIPNSSFPGNNYSDLAKWLSQNSAELLSASTLHHDLIALYDLGQTNIGRSHSFTQAQIAELRSVFRPLKDQV